MNKRSPCDKAETGIDVETVMPKQGIWRTYDATDGLPGGVECLLQDREGYLWRE